MGDCLFNIPKPGDPPRNAYQSSNYLNEYMEDLDTSFRFVLPGERYSANEQCKQIFGSNSYLCSFTVSKQGFFFQFFLKFFMKKLDFKMPCQVLWCKVPTNPDENCRTANTKWAEGTYCDDAKQKVDFIL
jgi:hypothetical protein